MKKQEAAIHSEIRTVSYAGENSLRRGFLEFIVGESVRVVAAGGGGEPPAPHPLPVAREKILFAREREAASAIPSDCYVAFDTLTLVPTFTSNGLYYETLGKPTSKEHVQRLFLSMSQTGLPYRIRSASALWCGGSEHAAWHDASIFVSPSGLKRLATDAGMATYAAFIKEFNHSTDPSGDITRFAAGLHLETLLALGCVEAIDGIRSNQQGFRHATQRAVFLASIGASHRVLGPLTHDPMGHIINFAPHQDRLALLGKYQGVI